MTRHGIGLHWAALALAAIFSAGPALAADGRAAKYYEEALRRYEQQDVAGSIIQLKNALQIDKSLLPVHVLLGKALLANGEAVAAEVSLRESLRLGVNRAEVVVPLAEAYIAQGRQTLMPQEAVLSTTGLPPGVQRRLLLLLSTSASDVGDARTALDLLAQARAIDPRAPDTLLAEVPIRIRTREFAAAAAAVEQALALAPDLPDVWYQKGSLAHVTGDLTAALAAYDRCIALQAQHVEALIARAGLQMDFNRLDAARRDVTVLARLAPREPRAAYLKALIADRSNDAASSGAALREVTALLDPVPVDFLRYRRMLLLLNGMAHHALNEREKAKAYLEAFQRVQGNTAASKLLAQMYLDERDVKRAVEVLELYLKAQPADPQALTLLASAQMAQGRHARATSLMQEALQASDRPEFRTALGLSLVGGGQATDGVVQLEAALRADPRQVQAAVALTRLYLRMGQPAKAAEVAARLDKQMPSKPSVLNLLGLARARAGDAAGARRAFEQASQIDAKLPETQINLARLDIATGAFEAAETRLGAVLKGNERNGDAMMEMSMLSQRRGRAADALRWLEKAVDVEGARDTRASLALVTLHLQARRNAAALDTARKTYAKAPDELNVLLAYTRSQLAVADRIGARNSLTTATRIAAFEAASQFEVANLQMAAGNLPGAGYCLEKALTAEPDFLPAMVLMTDIELRQGDFAKAEQRARRIVERNPKRAIGQALLGDVNQARGQTASALEAYRRAQQLEPSAEGLLRVLRSQVTSDPRGALQLAEQWVKSHPADAAVRRAIGDAQARAGQFAAARDAYAESLKAEPDSAAALNNLANVLLRLKDPGAIPIAERAMAADPGNAAVIDTLGWALFQNGQSDRALQLLRDARLRAPENADIRYHLAAVLAAGGRNSEAREELEAAVKSGRRFEHAADASALIAKLR